MFTPDQIQELLRIIEFQHVLYAGDTVGLSALSSEDRMRLESNGIDVHQRYLNHLSTLEESYLFGRLAGALGDKQTSSLKYSDFKRHIMNGAYRPLSPVEEFTLEHLKTRTYSHIKGLGQKVGSDVVGIVSDETSKRRKAFENIIKDEAIKKVKNRTSLNNMVLEIGRKTGDWERNIGRIVDTEMHNAFDEGRASFYESNGGKDVLVYKSVYDQACKHCIRLYTTNGIGSKPRIFKLSVLRNNGTNIGRKVADWKAVVGATHPHCRCTLHDVPAGYNWSDEDRSFSTIRKFDRKSSVKRGNIKITIGSEEFTI